MDRAVLRETPTASSAPLILLAVLPGSMVLFDLLTQANPIAALWSMPLPVVAILLILCGLTICSGKFRRPTWLERATIGLALWAGVVIALQAINPLYGLLRLGELALIAALATSIAALIRRHGPEFAHAITLALVFGVALSLPLVATAIALGWPQGYGPLELPGYAHIRIFGFALALALSAATGLWSRGPKFPLALAMVALAIALFWSGGRGALLALILPLPILALFLHSLRPGLVALAGALAVGFATTAFVDLGTAELGLAGRLGAGGTADALTSGRLTMWRTLWQAMAQAPILGHGLGQTHWLFAEAGHDVAHLHAHNIVLDAALAFGWPGALAAIGLAAFAWLRAARTTRSDLQATGLALVSVFLTLALVDGVYVYWPGLVPLAVGIGLAQAR